MTPRVAIACSGLGFVHRGNETWAATVAEGIHKSGGHTILFGSGPRSDARSPYVRVPCWHRDGWIRKFVSWEKAYLLEQITFARNLRRHLTPSRFDIIHTADPNLAQQLIPHARRQNLALIYQDALLIGPTWCSKFEHVQVLAPAYERIARDAKVDTSCWRLIPQLVDTRVFTLPKTKADNPFVVLAVGDFSASGNKRIDWIIEEFAKLESSARLLLVGNASPEETAKLRALATEKLKDRVEIVSGISHPQMPAIYQRANLFVHAATREPFGFVFIEAMASGLPAIGHDFEVTKWIIGDGGATVDMTGPGELTREIDRLSRDAALRNNLATAAIARAKSVFDKDVVLLKYHQWYNELLTRRGR
jgi:1,2-diacylglycerol 3-alpha-glucosyltransferase